MGRDTTTNAMTRTASRKKDSHRALPDLRQMQAVSRRCGAARHGHLLSRFEQATSDDGPHRQWRAPLASKVRNAASRYSVHASVLTDSHSPRLSKPPRARSPLLVRSFARSLVRVVAQNRRRVFTWGSLQCTPDCTHAQWRRSAQQTRRVSNSSNGEQQQALKATPAREPHRSRVHLIRGRGPDGGVVIAPMIHPWTAPPIPPAILPVAAAIHGLQVLVLWLLDPDITHARRRVCPRDATQVPTLWKMTRRVSGALILFFSPASTIVQPDKKGGRGGNFAPAPAPRKPQGRRAQGGGGGGGGTPSPLLPLQ